MLCGVTLDANNHLYPVAFGIVDSENHDSWKYFMSKLKEAIGEVEDLAFVSDKHASITYALETIFPDAYHGACYHYISMNVIAKSKTDHCHVLMYNAAYAFRKSEFHTHFEKIKSKVPAITQYLDGMGFDKWSRAYFPGNRYNIMTSNYAESFNNKTGEARSFSITTFVEFIRFTLQSWFCDRRETSKKTTTTLALTYEKDLVDMAKKARFLIPYAIGRHEFHVLDAASIPRTSAMLTLNGTNHKQWVESLMMNLTLMRVDLALRMDAPPKPTDDATEKDKKSYEEHSNRCCLMLMRYHMDESISDSIP
ncbi:uncharacterized protein LOC133779360 [Humulus lupulus]|uniref:uncharacterized protein LOC133779360 n=1 Tax=Humulus lupulus TaxID=3486 RepID=UPI002B40B8E4|nr:uncharacterized protein LOC133779360 [Humulus lupulus]